MSNEKFFNELHYFSPLKLEDYFPYNYYNFEKPSSAFRQNLEKTSAAAIEIFKKNGREKTK